MEKGLKDINFNEIKGLSKQEIIILNSIKERIESGKSAYKKCWSNVALENINYSTKNFYHGLNTLSLSIAKDEKGYISSSWLTFNQMCKLNEEIEKENKKLSLERQKQKIHLKKGSIGEKISFPVIYDRKNKKYLTYEEYNNIPKMEKENLINNRDITFAKKEFTVFNGDCFDNLDLSFEKEFLKNLEENKVEFKDKDIAVKLCENMNVELVFKNQNKAYYIPKNDRIILPTERQFYSNEEFKRIFFHELSHSTGHEKRLNREIKNNFGSKEYAFEEIVAESSSIFLSKKFGYLYDENMKVSAEYLKCWSDVLINESKRVINAIQKGNEAKEYIIKYFYELEKNLEKNDIIKEIKSTDKKLLENLELDKEIEEEFELEIEM